ncbi:MAG TPA: FAD-dependent monooxygenase [Ktedonobacterales bacterium]|nr:FAD-dependent monooxygenase [Ktedonobacterales bacterium]
MKITILGAGPAGLYAGLLLKKADSARAVTIVERNPPDATYGWGVVFSDRTLASFREADEPTYTAITESFVLWDAIDIHFRDRLMRCGGHVFAGMPRKLLLQILQSRCAELGVELRFQTEIPDLAALGDADLILAADGVNSLARKTHEQVFQPAIRMGRARYIWLGTDKPFDAFTFIFRENTHGFFQVHAYPFGGATSTFIVECDEETWRAAGLDSADEQRSIAYCEQLFRDDLRGSRLLGNNSKWISFPTVTCRHWHAGNLVLLGDSAHTAHFSIGSGTKLAMEDAIALAHAVNHFPTLESALVEYELERRPVVESLQRAARESQAYFERVRRTASLAPTQFSFHLLTRSGRITYDDLRLRDAGYVAGVDEWFARQDQPNATAPALIAPAPLFKSLRLRDMTLATRVAAMPADPPTARDGVVDAGYRDRCRALAARGAALVLTHPVAVTEQGRISPECPGAYTPKQRAAWSASVAAIHDAAPNARVALSLNHAGRRGATRPRRDGLDRPLRDGAWPLVSASPLPYTPRSQTPRELDAAGMAAIRDAFAQAARVADAVGFDALELHMGHGYLLASFISPLTNHREDEYGGSLERRLRFPLETLEAVRAVWPEGKPLLVALSVTDWAPGGLTEADAIAAARILAAHGCDLLHILAGQTTANADPPYGPGFLTPLSDRVRTDAGVPTLVGGYLTTANELNTMLAAGRADLCLLQLR